MSFSEIFKNKELVLSFEFFPPKSSKLLANTKSLIDELSGYNPDFMTCTYGAGGGTKESTLDIVQFISRDLGIRAVAHLTCVGHTTNDLKTIICDLESAGIENILALRGDPPKGETVFEMTEGGLSCAKDLVEFISKDFDLSLAVAGYPETHPEAISPEADIDYLKAKVDAGAELIVTQLFFDSDMYFSFKDRCAAAGIDVPILPGIMPIASIKQVRKFTGMCGASIPPKLSESLAKLETAGDEVSEFGTDYAIELVRELIAGGAPGIHLYTLNKSSQVSQIAEAAGFSKEVGSMDNVIKKKRAS